MKPKERAHAETEGLDRIEIVDLVARAVIGVYEDERTRKQDVVLTLTLYLSTGSAALEDRIDGTVDYRQVAKRIREFVEESQFQLIETLADACARLVLDEFTVEKVTVRVEKPGALRHARTVAVTVTRCRR